MVSPAPLMENLSYCFTSGGILVLGMAINHLKNVWMYLYRNYWIISSFHRSPFWFLPDYKNLIGCVELFITVM